MNGSVEKLSFRVECNEFKLPSADWLAGCRSGAKRRLSPITVLCGLTSPCRKEFFPFIAKGLQEVMRWAITTNRIDRLCISGKQKRLASATTKVDFFSWAFQASIRHPAIAAKALESA